MEAKAATALPLPKRRGGAPSSGRSAVSARDAAPSLAVIALVAAYPIGYAIWLSLNEYSVITPGLSRFVGFDNYTEALGSTEFWEAMKTTVLFTVISVASSWSIGLGMALVMHQAFRGAASLRTVVLVPWAILTVVTAITWRTMFEPELGLRQHDAPAPSRCREETSSGSARKATRWR